MKLDIQYLKALINRIQEHDKPDFDLNLIKDLWLDEKEINDGKLSVLVFHMELLEDQGFIESLVINKGLGFTRFGNGGIGVSVHPLRLTAQGHDFAAALVKPGVIDSLITTFKDLGPAETVKAVFKLASKVLDNQLGNITDD